MSLTDFFGYVIWIITSPSLKSNYPIFEWQRSEKTCDKVSLCFHQHSITEKSESEWEISLPKICNFKWCSIQEVLKKLGTVEEKRLWPQLLDLSDTVLKIPELQKIDKKRAEEELQHKRIEKEQ